MYVSVFYCCKVAVVEERVSACEFPATSIQPRYNMLPVKCAFDFYIQSSTAPQHEGPNAETGGSGNMWRELSSMRLSGLAIQQPSYPLTLLLVEQSIVVFFQCLPRRSHALLWGSTVPASSRILLLSCMRAAVQVLFMSPTRHHSFFFCSNIRH